MKTIKRHLDGLTLDIMRWVMKCLTFLSLNRIIGFIGLSSTYEFIRSTDSTYSLYRFVYDALSIHPFILLSFLVLSSGILIIYPYPKKSFHLFFITLPIQIYLWVSLVILNRHSSILGVTLKELIFLLIIYRQIASMFINEFLVEVSES